MRNIIGIALLLFFTGKSYAQESDTTRYKEAISNIESLLSQRRLDRSIVLIDSLLEEVDLKKHPQHFYRVEYLKATYLLGVRQIGEAQALLEKVEQGIETKLNRPHLLFGLVASFRGELLQAKGLLPEAITHFNKALEELSPMTDENSYVIQGRVSNMLGINYARRSYYDRGSDYLSRALRFYRQAEANPILISATLGNLGNLYQLQGKYETAVETYTESIYLKVKSLGNNHPSLLRTYSNLSSLYAKMGHYNKALEYEKQALRVAENNADPDTDDTEYWYANMALAYLNVRQDSLSRLHLNKAQSIFDDRSDKKPYIRADINYWWGTYYSKLNESEKAVKHYEKAIKYYETAYGKDFKNALLLRIYIAEIHSNNGQFGKAERLFDSTTDHLIRVWGPKGEDLTKAYLGHARLNMVQKRYDAALKSVDMAVASIGDFSDGQIDIESIQAKNDVLMAFLTKAYIHKLRFFSKKEEQDRLKAMHYYGLSDQLVDKLQYNGVYADHLSTLDTLDVIYDDAVALQYIQYSQDPQPKTMDTAFYFAERGKNVLLRQRLNQSVQQKFESLPKALLKYEQSLKEDIAYIESTIYNLKQANGQQTDTNDIDYYGDQLFLRKRSLDSLKARLMDDYPAYFNIRYEQESRTVTNLKEYLAPDTQVIRFVSTDNYIYVFSVTASKHDFIRIEKSEDFPIQVESFLAMIKNPSSSLTELAKSGKALYKTLLVPLGKLKQNLIFIPDGLLSTLPFEVLVKPKSDQNQKEHYLIQDHNVSYANTVKEIVVTAESRIPRKPEFMALASSYSSNNNDKVATVRGSLGELQWTVKEVKDLMKSQNGEAYLEKEATEGNFRKHASGKDIIHIASHGLVDHEQPLFSRLVLEKDPLDTINDGNLFVHELYNMSLEAQMVVLSACNTASGEMARGEGLLNIGRGFFYAGVPSVVMSHWQVDDQSTGIVMKYFYEYLADGQRKSEALREAKLRFISEASPNKKHPFYWGAFISMGDDSPISRKDSRLTTILIVFGVVLLIFFLRAARNRSQKAAT